MDDETTEAPAPQMSYKEALDYAIFAMNTLAEPQGSSDEDMARLDLHSDEIIETLVDMRSTVTGLP